MADKKITDYDLLTSGSINPNTALIEIVNFEQLINYKSTPEDVVGSVFSNKSTLKNLTQGVIDNSPTSGQKAALAGTDGTPGAGNPYVTDSDPRLTGSTGSITTASNIGDGEGQVYVSTLGTTLQLRSIKASGNVTITNNTNDITIFSGYSSGSVSSFKRFVLNEDMVVKDQVVILSNGHIRKLRYDSFGVASIFNSNDCPTGINLSKLNDTKFIVSYSNSAGASSNTAVKIGTVSSDYGISYGAEYVVYQVSGTQPFEHYVLSLTDSKFVVHYRNNDTNPNVGYAKIGNISGTSITFGTAYAFGTTDSNGGGETYQLIKLNDTTYITISRSPYFDVFVGSITGSIINFGSRYELDHTVYASNIDAKALTSSKFVIVYTRYPTGSSSNGSGSLKIGIIDNSTITFGDISTFSLGHYNQYSAVSSLSENKFVLAYSDLDTSGVVRICSVDGDIITQGDPYIFSSSSITNKKVISLATDRFVIFYNKPGGVNLRMGTVSGSIISFPADEHALTDSVYDAIQLNNSTVVIGATNTSTNNGYTKAGPISTFTISDRIAGVLQESGTAGQSKPVALFGDISVVHSELTPGELYYYNTSTGNDVIPSPVGYLAGLSLSSTELKIVSY